MALTGSAEQRRPDAGNWGASDERADVRPPSGRAWLPQHRRAGIRRALPRTDSRTAAHRRGVAWWLPGVRDVVNGLEVVPPEEDDDGEISDAVRLVLEKGPLVDASQLGVSTHQTLTGVVRSEVERQAPRGHCDEEAEVIDREAKKRPRPMMPE